MTLRDDRQAAINDVITFAKQTADHYEDAAARVSDEALVALFRDAAARRHDMAARLSDEIKHMHDLPRSPDRDREAVQQVISRIKGLVAGDDRLVLLEEREEGDHALANRIAAALREDLPAALADLLHRYHEDVIADRDRLAAARTAA